ncbi:MAG: cation diffusion facilitator family transporter [Anaeroplasmataceae bacterium]|nr:cation diffusion facilitator family transporter [Anaeroplasmataceae bacterium]
MINLIRKLFIKDYQNVKDEKVRVAHGKVASFFGIFSNLILFIGKMVAGILSASISIIADSINNLSDMGSSVITLVGFKLSSAPADDEHPYGHQRMEYIAGLIVAVIIIFVGGSLFISSIEKIIDYQVTMIPKKVLYISISILSCSILIKLLQAIFNHKMGKIINSVTLKATSKDSLNDCISTSAILIVNVVFLFIQDIPFSLDGVLGILVSLFIVISGVKLIKEAVNPLIGVSTDEAFIKEILSVIQDEPLVLGFHDPVCHMYGPTKCFMTIHVEVDAKLNMMMVHDSIDNLEKQIFEHFGVELTIHMDPIETDNEQTNALRTRVKEVIKGIDTSLSMHDFRVVYGSTHNNLIFDVVRPYKFKLSDAEILRILQNNFKEEEIPHYFVVHFDNQFVKDEDLNKEFEKEE